MIENIKQILIEIKDISGYRIIENKIESDELFLVKKGLDMNRAKSVHNFSVTVYKDFEEADIKYRGSSTTTIHPTMDTAEIKAALLDSALAAGFVKNELYPLATQSEHRPSNIESNLSKASLENWLPKIIEAIYKEDNFKNGGINSTEVFLNKIYTRIVNSEGIDVSFESYKGEIEFITDWKEGSEEIELYKRFNFSDFEPEAITEMVSEQLKISKEKAIAKPTPVLNKFTVLLTGKPVEEMFSYYYMQSAADSIYNQSSKAVLNENIQGDNVKGDLINLSLNPHLENSTNSSPYDRDGYLLQTVKILENGVLKRYWGDIRHCHYLKVEPTGQIKNMVIDGGKYSLEKFKNEPYLELIAFSDFQMNPLTGDFGGEIRLGWYFDGHYTIPVTGGSVSGNIKELHTNMYLSKELQKNNGFFGPKTIKLENVSVSGIA